MREKLELKIIITVLVMLLIGVVIAGAMTMLIEKVNSLRNYKRKFKDHG